MEQFDGRSIKMPQSGVGEDRAGGLAVVRDSTSPRPGYRAPMHRRRWESTAPARTLR